MKSPLLILDVSSLAYRALHTTGEMKNGDDLTGVCYGLLQQVIKLQETLLSNRLAWCFDCGYDGRAELYPQYKANRNEGTEEEKELRRGMRQQLYRMRTKYLPMIGFKNIFIQDGYEADDIVASLCVNLPRGEQAIIVSSDRDLLQCLVDDKITVWNPNKQKQYTANDLRADFGVGPGQWALVKALAGDNGDNVEGIDDIGEKTAALYIAGRLKDTSKRYAKIINGDSICRRNLPLVTLPFPGTQVFSVVEDEITNEGWDAAFKEMGIKNLRGRIKGREKESAHEEMPRLR